MMKRLKGMRGFEEEKPMISSEVLVPVRAGVVVFVVVVPE